MTGARESLSESHPLGASKSCSFKSSWSVICITGHLLEKDVLWKAYGSNDLLPSSFSPGASLEAAPWKHWYSQVTRSWCCLGSAPPEPRSLSMLATHSLVVPVRWVGAHLSCPVSQNVGWQPALPRPVYVSFSSSLPSLWKEENTGRSEK